MYHSQFLYMSHETEDCFVATTFHLAWQGSPNTHKPIQTSLSACRLYRRDSCLWCCSSKCSTMSKMGDSFGMLYLSSSQPNKLIPISVLLLLFWHVSVCPTPSPPSLWYQWTKGTASVLLWSEGASASLRVSSAGGGVLPAGGLRHAGGPRWPAADQGGHGGRALLWTQKVLSPLGR